MIIRTETYVIFRIPDDHEEHERFVQDNDLSEWKEMHTTLFWGYRKTTVQEIRRKG